jgi:hypothetical protein
LGDDDNHNEQCQERPPSRSRLQPVNTIFDVSGMVTQSQALSQSKQGFGVVLFTCGQACGSQINGTRFSTVQA